MEEVYIVSIVGLIVGVSEVFKKTGLKKKYVPICNLILGIGAGFIVGDDIKGSIIIGIFMGLSASGLYSSVKNVSQGVKVDNTGYIRKVKK